MDSQHFLALIELKYHPAPQEHHKEPEADEYDEAQAQHELNKLVEKRNSE